jgi:hypothetical protein
VRQFHTLRACPAGYNYDLTFNGKSDGSVHLTTLDSFMYPGDLAMRRTIHDLHKNNDQKYLDPLENARKSMKNTISLVHIQTYMNKVIIYEAIFSRHN